MKRWGGTNTWLVFTGLGSWGLFVASLVLSGGWVLNTFPSLPIALSNWLFYGAAIAAVVSAILFFRFLNRSKLLSVPLVSGIAGVSLLSVGIVLAATKWLR